MEKALKIAQNFLLEHGSMPYILIVAEDTLGETNTWIGNFRKQRLEEDQKVFCGLMRTAFAVNRVASYSCVINADMKIEDGKDPKNVLVITEVTPKERTAKVFEIVSDKELHEVMTIEANDYLEGMYLELMPKEKFDIPEDVVKGINAYLETIAYAPPSMEDVVVVTADGLQLLLETGMD